MINGKGVITQLDTEEVEFRQQIVNLIRLFAASKEVLSPEKRIESILTRLEGHNFNPPDKKVIDKRVAKIRRFISAEEFGSAIHELFSLNSFLLTQK